MKTRTTLLVMGVVAGLGLGRMESRAELEISASVSINATADFYAPLTPHGGWVTVGSYGRCWRPASVEVGWRPYCSGHWVWTDVGWYWESDEPWGWATYHYGSWVYEGAYGWVWVPGIEWAPAWVVWRTGGGYCGWAPCAPRGAVVANVGFVFVESRRFHEPVRTKTVIVNNTTIINQTTVVGGQRHESRTFANAGSRKVIVNEGPSVESVQQASGKTITRVAIHDAAARTQVPAGVRSKSAPEEKRAAPEEKRAAPEKTVRPERRPDPDPAERFTPPGERSPKPEHPAPPTVKPESPGKPQAPDRDDELDKRGKAPRPSAPPTGKPGGKPGKVRDNERGKGKD